MQRSLDERDAPALLADGDGANESAAIGFSHPAWPPLQSCLLAIAWYCPVWLMVSGGHPTLALLYSVIVTGASAGFAVSRVIKGQSAVQSAQRWSVLTVVGSLASAAVVFLALALHAHA